VLLALLTPELHNRDHIEKIKNVIRRLVYRQNLLQPEQSSDRGDPRALPIRTVPKVLKDRALSPSKIKQRR